VAAVGLVLGAAAAAPALAAPATGGNRSGAPALAGNRSGAPALAGNRSGAPALAGNRSGAPALAGNRSGAPALAGALPIGIEITPPVRQALQQLQEQWLQWVGASNPQGSQSAAADILATARQLGMERLPDLAFGALARAVQAARQKDFARAHWALEAAERLDPGRPEAAFATAAVARLEGNYARAFSALASGAVRLFSLPLERYLWLQSLLLWALTLLLLTGALFVGALMATRGAALFHDLAALGARRLPRPVAVGTALVFLCWPLLLPAGPLWLAVFWSILLWGYASVSERTLLVSLWLLLAASPVVVAQQRRQVSLALSPPMQAMQSLQQHRLYGGLFADLGVLRSLLPDSPAVKQLLADLHRSLNQWEIARSLYRQVLEAEPRNTSVMLNLGAYCFFKADWSGAIDYFTRASVADPRSAAAAFDLSQAYAYSRSFDRGLAVLAQAKEIDSQSVDRWLRAADQQRVVTSAGGFARIPEIRRVLATGWSGQEAMPPHFELGRHGLPLLAAAAVAALAAGLHAAFRALGSTPSSPRWPPPRVPLGRWLRVLFPGLPSAQSGEGLRAFCALLLPTALLILPLFDRLGYRIPWGYDLDNSAAWPLSILGLLLYLAARLGWELRTGV
jgi:tetratricopeptide (TPR) repeat protein